MISIFARPSYLGNRFPRHTKDQSAMRLSSRIRGEEMAAYLGAKLNPTSGYENDVCIHIKHFSKEIRDGHWFDFLDGENNLPLLKERPGINVIASSLNSYDILTAELKNKVVLIPTHHINIDRLSRTRTKVTTAGYIGSPSPTAFKIYREIGRQLKKVGIDFKTCFNFKTMDDAINLYQGIDIFIIGAWQLGDENPHKIPTKIINAASFGVPTIAYPLAGYKELENNYIRANDMEELLIAVDILKNPKVYKSVTSEIRGMAEHYHISEIAELYRKLS